MEYKCTVSDVYCYSEDVRKCNNCTCIYTHVHIHTYIHACIHTYERRLFSLQWLHAHTYTRTYMYIQIIFITRKDHTYIHAYIHTYIYTYIHEYMNTYIHTYRLMFFTMDWLTTTYERVQVMHTYIWIYMYVYASYVCMCILVYVYVCAFIVFIQSVHKDISTRMELSSCFNQTFAYLHMYIHTSAHVYTYAQSHIPAYVHTYICTWYIRTYARVYTYAQSHVYTYTCPNFLHV
jgi:hypothetical protein